MNRFRKIVSLVVISQAMLVNAGEQADLIFTDSFERCEIARPLPPGIVDWDGGGDGTSWSDPQNWSGDILPVNGDTVVIDGTTMRAS